MHKNLKFINEIFPILTVVKNLEKEVKFKVNFYIVVQFIHLSKEKFLSFFVTLVTRSFRHHKIS